MSGVDIFAFEVSHTKYRKVDKFCGTKVDEFTLLARKLVNG